MLIVVSDIVMRKNEANIINALFDEGLDIFHLRRPNASTAETGHLLQEIDPLHHSKISLHQDHELKEIFGIKRLHYPEAKRKTSNAEELMQLQSQGFILSTSVHNLNEVLPGVFDYAFYGPVFDSISKQNYQSVITENFVLPKAKNKWIAIGGIEQNNCAKALELGFDGIAVLGAIWLSNNPINEFKKIKAACNLTAR